MRKKIDSNKNKTKQNNSNNINKANVEIWYVSFSFIQCDANQGIRTYADNLPSHWIFT